MVIIVTCSATTDVIFGKSPPLFMDSGYPCVSQKFL